MNTTFLIVAGVVGLLCFLVTSGSRRYPWAFYGILAVPDGAGRLMAPRTRFPSVNWDEMNAAPIGHWTTEPNPLSHVPAQTVAGEVWHWHPHPQGGGA